MSSSISIYKNFQNLPQNIQQKLLEFEQTYKSVKDLPNKFVKDTPTFIYKSLLVHGDKYDYHNVNYINSKQKIIIVCREHGKFLQNAHDHLRVSGCPKCGGSFKLTKEEFVKRADKVHDNKYDYSKFVYKTIQEKGIITCPIHGDFKQQANSHLRGEGCPFCKGTFKLTKKEFVKRAEEVHKNFYNYSKFEYKNIHNKSIIICPIHGEFLQNANNHINNKQGCPKCGGTSKKSLEELLEEANKTHNYFYQYDKFVYTSIHEKGIITCPIHGDFEQSANAHKRGQGCPKCADERRKIFKNKRWEDVYENGILYLIECWNDVERFVKIGVTAFSVEERFRRQRDMPYNYKVLEEIKMDSKSCIEYEQHVIDISESYKPKINFGGDSECLVIDEKYYLQDLLERIERL